MDLHPRGRKISPASRFIIFTLAVYSHGINRVHSGPNERQGLQCGNRTNQCNLFSGTWIRDASYPLYTSSQCPLIKKEFNCRGNGRPDSDYEKWRWQPDGCNIPRFNATDMMERLRGKRLMFVGDSISENQYYSMVCLVHGLTNNTELRSNSESNLTTFSLPEYNASIQLHWAPFLVDIHTNQQGQKVLHLDAIENNGAHWKGVDLLVFETSHWWTGNPPKWNITMEGNETKTGMDPMEAYRKALVSWSNWVSKNLDPRISQVFYCTTSLRHGPGCENYTQPVQNTSANSTQLRPQVSIAKEIVHDTKFPVGLLDITKLTVSRRDAHVSTYGSPEKNNGSRADCSHWCLPGVPDEWNRLVYATLALTNATNA